MTRLVSTNPGIGRRTAVLRRTDTVPTAGHRAVAGTAVRTGIGDTAVTSYRDD